MSKNKNGVLDDVQPEEVESEAKVDLSSPEFKNKKMKYT